jgi:alkanesulfonate monooxygenase SsuD/methylene tetrahydromethanopterin reductase-like flavin-dependent oxidoreductase (luciferase family)
MRFSIFTTLHDTGDGETPDKTLDDFREQCVFAEALGYHGVWIGEHHFGPYGGGDLPNAILIGADIAARTSHIRIGQMANIATWWHPIRLAEDIAILDNLTKGRVEAGFGRGIWPYEGPQFHPHADTRLEQENRALFRETIECMKKVWTEEHFSHDGPNYTFPAPGTRFKHPLYPSDPKWQDGDQVTRLRVTPKPYQKPHPPLWATVSTDRSVAMAAELGLKACYWQPPARRIHERCKVYAEVRGKREGRPFRLGEDQAVLRNTYVAGSMEEAKRDAEEGILSIFQYNDPYRGTQVFLNPGEKADPDTKLSWDFLEPRALLVGSPEHIIERLEEHQEICGLDEILVGYAHQRVSQKKTLKNLELFATKVMPHFQKKQEAAAE